MDKVAVVILNWNGAHFIEKFLPGIINHSAGATVYIADNQSTDQSLKILEEKFPDICVIQNGENAGFSKGYNLALKRIKAEYYVLLNSDVEVTPGWLDAPIKLLQSNKDIAACQPKVLSYHLRQHFDHAGAAGGLIDYLGYPFCRGRYFDYVEKDEGQYDNEQPVFWATGACLFIKSDLFWKAGAFEDDFFAHMEEIDLCWRLKNMGYQIWYTCNSVIYHVGGGTLSRRNPFKTYLNFRNGMVLLYKNIPEEKFRSTIFVRFLLDWVAIAFFMISWAPADAKAVIKAHFHFLKNIKKWSESRKRARALAIYQNHKEMLRKSVVLQYFLKGKHSIKEFHEGN